jgi:hypothetical protein
MIFIVRKDNNMVCFPCKKMTAGDYLIQPSTLYTFSINFRSCLVAASLNQTSIRAA